MSLIHYKFKSAKNYDSVSFEGLGFTLFDLKREILIAQKLKGTDSDIIVSNAQSNEDYLDDTQMIPKNTSVFVRRVPSKPGGTNAMYYLGDNVQNVLQTAATATDSRGDGLGSIYNDDDEGNDPLAETQFSMDGVLPGENEEDQLKALFDQTSNHSRQQFAQMSGQSGNFRSGPNPMHGQRGNNNLNRPISAHYVCHRCGIKGHYVTNCPNQGDRRVMAPKVKKTTGIPRSFLKSVEEAPEGKSTMVTNEGNLVIAQANNKAWEKIQLNQMGNGASIEELRETAPVPSDLECQLCNKLLSDAVSVPCCSQLFCSDCITRSLLDTDPNLHHSCPLCQRPNIVPDSLITESGVQSRVDEHLRQWGKEVSHEHNGDYNNEHRSHSQREGKPHTSHGANQIMSVGDSREYSDNWRQSRNQGSHRDNFKRNNFQGGKSFEDRGSNFQAPSDMSPSQNRHFIGSDSGRNDNPEESSEGPMEEMPVLRWTPVEGMSGHVVIPPLETLVGTDYFEDNFKDLAKIIDKNLDMPRFKRDFQIGEQDKSYEDRGRRGAQNRNSRGGRNQGRFNRNDRRQRSLSRGRGRRSRNSSPSHRSNRKVSTSPVRGRRDDGPSRGRIRSSSRSRRGRSRSPRRSSLRRESPRRDSLRRSSPRRDSVRSPVGSRIRRNGGTKDNSDREPQSPRNIPRYRESSTRGRDRSRSLNRSRHRDEPRARNDHNSGPTRNRNSNRGDKNGYPSDQETRNDSTNSRGRNIDSRRVDRVDRADVNGEDTNSRYNRRDNQRSNNLDRSRNDDSKPLMDSYDGNGGIGTKDEANSQGDFTNQLEVAPNQRSVGNRVNRRRASSQSPQDIDEHVNSDEGDNKSRSRQDVRDTLKQSDSHQRKDSQSNRNGNIRQPRPIRRASHNSNNEHQDDRTASRNDEPTTKPNILQRLGNLNRVETESKRPGILARVGKVKDQPLSSRLGDGDASEQRRFRNSNNKRRRN